MHVARMRERAYRVLFNIILPSTPRGGWEDNTKLHLYKIGLGRGLHWSGSGYEHVECSCEIGDGPSGFIKCGEFLD